MRIGIDVRYLSHGLMGGIHTYVQHFVPALIELAPDHRIYLYADTKRPFELQGVPDHVTVRFLPWVNPLSSILNDLFLLHGQMAHDSLDVVHFTANYGFGPSQVPTIITLHDAINILPLREIVRGHPKTPHTVAMMSYVHFCTKAALSRADLVLTTSAHARCEIARYAGFDPQRIVPVPHAPLPDARRIDDAAVLSEVLQRYGLKRPFVLADALKNPTALVEAWRLLPRELREDNEIVFFSRHLNSSQIINRAAAAGYARLLVRPPREDLIALYSMAKAFVFPSWIEGFGIPVLEAMACGAPVIASNRGAIPEVAGDAALLADVDDIKLLAEHITLVLSKPDEAQRLRERGFSRASQFSWQDTARRILESYGRVVPETPRRDDSLKKLSGDDGGSLEPVPPR